MAHRKLSYLIIGLILLIGIVVALEDRQDEVTIARHSDLYTEREEDFEFSEFRSQKVEYLIIHCTATQAHVDRSKRWYLDFFKNYRKWDRPGYHMIIAPNGRIDTLVRFDNDGYVQFHELANGVAGHNSRSIHISYQGGIDRKGNPKDTRTAAQKEKLQILIMKIKTKFPWIKIRGHNDFAQKACPSFDAKKEYAAFN
jgi:N-acetylmuramoyl-L-alanine amidase